MTINQAQELYLQLIEIASFNSFDGKQVSKELRENKQLWKATLMTRPSDLIYLRDLDKNDNNVDTLFIRPEPGKEEELQALAENWSADEVYWVGGEKACEMLGQYSPELRSDAFQLLVVWWD